MEQQQFRISLSVGSKLLISIVLLLMVLVGFLSASTVYILTQDKQAYTFETKSMEASLSGGELSQTIQHVVDTLRMSLASVDPGKPVDARGQEALKSVLANQSDVASVSLVLLDTEQSKWTPIATAENAKVLESNELSAAQLAAASQISAEWTKTLIPAVTASGFGFINLSTQGIALLGVVLTDRNFRVPGSSSMSANSLPSAIGVVPLKHFGNDLTGLNLTVATHDGWVLYDTDPTALFSHRNIKNDPLLLTALSSKFKTGTQAYKLDGESYLGGFSKPGYDLVVITRASWDQAMRATYAVTEKFILLGGMAIGIGVIFAIFFAKTISRPIQALYQGAQEVGKGNFNLTLEPQSRDELGALTVSFNAMSTKIQDLFKESIEKTVLEKELDIAATVQRTLIPPTSYQDENTEFYSHYQSASRCGGDWWGLFRVGNKLVFGIADATGHGFNSALITASARSCFSVMNMLAQEDPDFSYSPSAMLSFANRAIYEASQGSVLLTTFFGVFDFDSQTMTYANAAHNPPWFFKREGDRFKLNSLTPEGPRLGEKPEIDPIPEQSLEIGAGDMLFLYTDGLIEGKAAESDEMFGKKRARKVVEANLAAGPKAVVDSLMGEFTKFHGPKELDDDITLAVVRLRDPQDSSFGPG